MEMVKRFFSLFNVKKLTLVLLFLYMLILTSDSIKGIGANLLVMFMFTILVFMVNENVIENWKWVKTGKFMDIADNFLDKQQKELKAARQGKINPLFLCVNGKYYYYEDKYQKAELNEID